MKLVKSGDISNKIAKDVFMKAFDEDKDPVAIVKEEGLQQISDTDSLAPMIQEIIDNNPKSVADYKAGKKKAVPSDSGQDTMPRDSCGSRRGECRVIRDRQILV